MRLRSRSVLVAMAHGARRPSEPPPQEPEKEPIGRFAADVRVALAAIPGDAVDGHGARRDGRATCRAAAWDWPRASTSIRRAWARSSLGVGGEWLVFSRGSKTLDPETEGAASGPTVTTDFSVLSPQVSLNFGGRNGWSYLSGGIGWAAFTTELEGLPVADPDGRTRSINYGGGARWFAKEHLAFAFDLRFYKINAQEATPGRPAYGGRRMMVFSAGVSLK